MKTTFSERFAFARVVQHFRTGKSPGNAELGRVVDRTGPWVTKWAASDEPPTDYRVHAPLAAFLDVEERWLFRGEGEPPMPGLWAQWSAQRRADPRPGYMRVAERLNLPVAGEPAAAKKAASKAKRKKA